MTKEEILKLKELSKIQPTWIIINSYHVKAEFVRFFKVIKEFKTDGVENPIWVAVLAESKNIK